MKIKSSIFIVFSFGLLSGMALFAIQPNSEATIQKIALTKAVNYEEGLQEGDLIFQISQSPQCIAVQAAT